MLQAQQRIILVRHPETQANVDGLLVGISDSPWTARGYEQAQSVIEALKSHQFDRVITSPLERTFRLADMIATHHDKPLTIENGFIEIDFGQAEGLSYRETHARQIVLNYEHWDQPIASGAESRAQVDERVGEALQRIMADCVDTLVVAHGGTIRSALTQLLGLEPHQGWSFTIRNTGIAAVNVIEMRGFLEMLV